MSLSAVAPLALLTPGNSAVNNAAPLSGAGTKTGPGLTGANFGKFLGQALQQVDGLQKNADAASIALATGQAPDIHSVMIALDKASLAMSLTVEVRNKAMDAYQELMRMQI
ncbi:Flagellar hook-basal body complex protein FliE [Acididesulfobacillus acetoxydans]|uniref:Flagellar hook-basal body complex protein FliE n=1 Tax=Acididesulfobacillus acetoxydans TaxID=1561005 RepID=A0A8S0W9X9_9FIRM|nr:flagellar hook-basal body complex protein FliE [Acididesulfobacillus acetoxydans]CAA7602969.1 Flagellar hook-basal body complex protein FliE [Acididesulfobacillus acetoxydans]CEJ05851.1 Flagellar hook-basal body complex protein FliE [Acididesulfobacillus acetoxydans]